MLSMLFRVTRNKYRKYLYKKMLKKGSNQDRFSQIYADNLWSSSESGSGTGSEVAYTEALRPWIRGICLDIDCVTFVDAACGDFNWMSQLLPELDVKYFGYDIVPEVIQRNINQYSTDNTTFQVADICNDPLPSCDLLMIRDCLFHLSFSDINKVLENINKVDYKYLLTTTHDPVGNFKNLDILSGDFRWLDLRKDPICLNEKTFLSRFNEPPQNGMPRSMIMIRKEDVPQHIRAHIS